jgi:hypothetical protein
MTKAQSISEVGIYGAFIGYAFCVVLSAGECMQHHRCHGMCASSLLHEPFHIHSHAYIHAYIHTYARTYMTCGMLNRDGKTEHLNVCAGYLVRTKPGDVDEGGVAAGYAFLDSLCLENA